VIGRKENIMRVEQAQAKKGPKGVLLGAVMGLAFVAGVFLSLVAPTDLDTSSIEVGKPEAAEIASTTPDRGSPGEATASFDLQLD
jgi:hypothetical protein